MRTEHHQPLFERCRLEDDVHRSRLTHGTTGLGRIEVTREQDGVVRDLGQAVVERAIELFCVATGEIRTTAAVEKEGVSGDQPVLDKEALAARCVTWRVNQLDVDGTHTDRVAGCVGDERVHAEAGDLLDELGLRTLHVNRHVHLLEELGNPVEVIAHHGSAHVISVIVRGQRARDGHAVLGCDVDERVRVVCRVDYDSLARLPVANEVTEVDHLLGNRIVGGKVPAGQQLTEIQTFAHERTVIAWATVTGTDVTRRIAFLGPLGTFSEEAIRSQADLVEGAELVPMRTFVDILQETQAGNVDLGFVAIENAIEGTVNASMDALAFSTDLLIQREVVLDITMHLMALPGTELADIKTVISHPVATAQCAEFLRREIGQADVEPASSTAEGARLAGEQQGVACVGPAAAGELHGLVPLATDVADMKGNHTRFLVVAKAAVPAPSGHDKTTIVLTQREDKPGSLVSILHEFSARNLNLSRLTSRPTRTTLGQYCFIVDVDGHIDDEVVANCLRNVRAKHADVKFLGSYPAAGNGSDEVREANNDAWDEADRWMAGIRSQIQGATNQATA